MLSAEASRNIVGIIGNVLSFVLFASPAPTFWRIIKNKSVEEFKPDPYIACVMNCLFWIFYGLPIVHPDSTLVITINGVGLGLELIYLGIFMAYGDNNKRKKILIWLTVEAVVLAAVACFTLLTFHTHTRRSLVVGIFCVVFGVLMYASPLTIMMKVIKTKSVEFMPFTLSIAACLNGICWTVYALLKFDLFILIGNGSGAVCGLVQIILYVCYYSTTPKKGDVKKSEVQLPTVPKASV